MSLPGQAYLTSTLEFLNNYFGVHGHINQIGLLPKIAIALFASTFIATGFAIFGMIHRTVFGKVRKPNVHRSQAQASATINYQPKDRLSDQLKSSWCKKIADKITGGCCPIFDYITTTHGDRPFGDVLDAGTGNHSLEWVLGCKTDRWVAVTGDEKRKNQMKDTFKGQIRDQDEIVVGNWKNNKFMKDQQFDVVLADYLVGSIDAFAPYFQDKIFERLRSHVKQDGRLYVTGAEPIPDYSDDVQGQLVIEVCKTRDACILLAGERPYREFPLDLMLKYLARSGFSIDGVAFFETTYELGYVENQIRVADSKLHKVRNEDLAASLRQHIKELKNRVRSVTWGFTFGSDYVIVASPTRGTEKQVDIKDFKPDYTSPVQIQEAIYPLDEK